MIPNVRDRYFERIVLPDVCRGFALEMMEPTMDQTAMREARYKSYVICTSPRSGSTLLCKMLAATGISGKPDSHFHTPSIERWLETFKISRADFLSDRDVLNAIFQAARARGEGNTGVFGLRLQRASFDYFIHQVGFLYPGLSSDRDRIQAVFGPTLFIYLTRPDKLDQAISYVRAMQSGLWHKATDGTELERKSAPQEPIYDSDAIARHLTELAALDEAWGPWFESEELQPLHVSYDDLSDNPSGVLSRILDELGLDSSVANDISPPTARLSDETNKVWAQRFRAEHGGF